MKHGNDNRTNVHGRTSMSDQSVRGNSLDNGRVNPSQSTPNPNRGLNEDEQKQTTNQEEEDEITNVGTKSSSDRGDSKKKRKPTETSKTAGKRNQKQ